MTDTLLAPAAAGGRAIAGGRWALVWPPSEASAPEVVAWLVNGLMLAGAALMLLDMLLVSSGAE